MNGRFSWKNNDPIAMAKKDEEIKTVTNELLNKHKEELEAMGVRVERRKRTLVGEYKGQPFAVYCKWPKALGKTTCLVTTRWAARGEEPREWDLIPPKEVLKK